MRFVARILEGEEMNFLCRGRATRSSVWKVSARPQRPYRYDNQLRAYAPDPQEGNHQASQGELSYPFHDREILVTTCGRICIHRKKINVSHVLSGQTLGLREVDNNTWLVSFMDYDLGYVDLDENALQRLENLFGPRQV